MDEKPVDLLPVLKIAAIFLTLVVAVFITIPFLNGSQIFRGHDTFFNLIALRGFTQAFFEGQIPVRIIPGVFPGLDGPVFNYYQPMFFYLVSLIKIFPISNILSLNLTILGLWLASGGFMFAFVRRHFGTIPALVSSVFYVLAPYHISQVLVRAAFTEFSAMAFIPAVLYTQDLLFEKQTGRRLFLASLTAAVFFLSHNVLAVVFSPVILSYIFYLFWQGKKKAAFFSCLLSIGFALSLAAFFFIPALQEGGYSNVSGVNSGQGDFRLHFVCPNQLFNPEWGYGASVRGCEDGMSFQVGLVHWLVVLIALAATAVGFWKRKTVKVTGIILFFLLAFVFSVFMVLEISLPIWERVGLLNYFQFPWRYLALTAFSSAILSGALIFFIKKETGRYIFGLVLISLALFFYSFFVKPVYFFENDFFDFNNKFLYNLKENNEVKEYLESVWVFNSNWEKRRADNFLNIPLSEAEDLKGDINIQDYSLTSTQKTYQIKASEESLIRFYTHYFPLWKVFVDGKEADFTIEKELGYILLDLPPGDHRVDLTLHDTPLREWANRITLVSAAILVIISSVYGKIWPRKYGHRE